MITNNEYKNIIAFHPGEYVNDLIDDLNITQEEFAYRLGTTPKTVSKIVNGEESISQDIAYKLEKLTGVSFETWINLQSIFDKKVLEIKDEKEKDEISICDSIDFSYFRTHGYLTKSRYSLKEKIKELRKLLNLSDLTLLTEFNANVSYRNTQTFDELSIINSNVMLELAIKEARLKNTPKYNKRKLESRLPRIKEMTFLELDEFIPKLENLLLEAGIALVILPNLKNSKLNGAVKRFKDGSVMLLVTDRNKRSDIFWFSLLHEIAHIYHNDFNSNYDDLENYNKSEALADTFASNYFIPEALYNDFLSKNVFDRNSILELSETCSIDPSIVVGRLQHHKILPYSQFNDLRKIYTFNIN